MNRLWPAAHPRYWGLRVRGALIVVAIVALAVMASAAVMVVILHRSLISAADAAASIRIREATAQLTLDTPGELDRSVLATDARLRAVQIIDPAGHVVQKSFGAPDEPLTRVRPGVGKNVYDAQPVVADSGLRLTAATVSHGGQSFTIVVAVNSDDIDNTISLVLTLFGIGGPLIVAAAAGATYVIIGRSLHSVEVIRSRVAAISSADLSQRVPIPPPKDEIAALAVTMNHMLARIDASHTAQRRFTSNASHELRSPLTTISTVLQFGRRPPTGDIDSDTVDTILVPETERMRRLVEDLLLLARADENGLPLTVTDIDLDYLVVSETTRSQAQTPLQLRTSVIPVRICGDEPKLGRAVRNVLDNACRYAATTVTVSLSVVDGNARIAINDDGPGISPDERERVFDRFHRPDVARDRDSGGSGLGLAIVAEIIAAHHGSVSLDCPPQGGTTVVVVLPLVPPKFP